MHNQNMSTATSTAPIKGSTMNARLPLFMTLISFLFSSQAKAKKPKKSSYSTETSSTQPYVFSWPDYQKSAVKLRGGMTTGQKVTLSTAPSSAWTALQSKNLSSTERDQAAIRALSGEYKVSFDFLESVVFGNTTEPATPYRSWATEKVYVIEDRPGFISMQHIMVMYFIDDKGVTQGPMVMKHWRQDWEHQPKTLLEYRGYNHWSSRALSAEESEGLWSWTVYQVDDTPRYGLLGKWEHNASFSAWTSPDGWRPLPRRERTVRKDYQIIDGQNRLTVMPTGWVHEQDNIKVVLTEEKSPQWVINEKKPAVARELGINRYQQVTDVDFSAGDEYWNITAPYWATVRAELSSRFDNGERLHINPKCNDEPAFFAFFGLANEVETGALSENQDIESKVKAIFDCIATESSAGQAKVSPDNQSTVPKAEN